MNKSFRKSNRSSFLIGIAVGTTLFLFAPTANIMAQKKQRFSVVAGAGKTVQNNAGLIGKWTAGSLPKGLFSLVIGENGHGTFTILTDKKIGENESCRCKYSSKINFTWKAKRDSLVLFFAETANDDGQSIVSSDAQPQAQKICEEISCSIIKITVYGMTQKLKGNYLRGTYILAGNTLDFDGLEYKKE